MPVRLPIMAAVVAFALTAFTALSALAHHGWSWAEEENSELTGVVESTSLGNPHGTVTLMVDGAAWEIEVGQPWRNERAGLSEENLSKGTEITVQGHRSRAANERRLKAERVIIDGKLHDLYPGRD
ncbi:DUF6152 family protein [Fodinicurvata fenggangensis]|uniref:DUF6152 family protein n=1 Tax=Fodinicurvata fenggangensis TaxID=1121830 RepID=UPI00047D29AF|nr:DUF6152 family protein [Fodinicurvata fenggangensis]